MHRAARSTVTRHGHRLFIRYIVRIEQIEPGHGRVVSVGRCRSRTDNRTTASFRIQVALAPVVTADTSFVNPFLHTKLRKNKKDQRHGVHPEERLNRHRSFDRPRLLLAPRRAAARETFCNDPAPTLGPSETSTMIILAGDTWAGNSELGEGLPIIVPHVTASASLFKYYRFSEVFVLACFIKASVLFETWSVELDKGCCTLPIGTTNSFAAAFLNLLHSPPSLKVSITITLISDV